MSNYADFSRRMEAAQDIAASRRGRDPTGGAQLVSSSVRQAALDAAYPDDEARLEYMADYAERIERDRSEPDYWEDNYYSEPADAIEDERAMTAEQFRKLLQKLGLTQGQAAKFFRVHIRTINGWANGKPIPHSVAMLLRLMVKMNLKPEEV